MRFMYWPERLWRQCITLFCFVLFGVGGVLLSFIWFNGLFLFCRNKPLRVRLARRSVSYSFRLFLRVTKVLGVMSYTITGAEKLHQDKGCLILANHPTLLDYVLIASVMPDVDCLVKSALLRNPFVSGVIRACHYLVNNQHDILLEESRERLAQGDNLLIFPAGTRTTPGVRTPFQRGAANIALRCDCPVRFIHIYNSETALTKQSRWYDIPQQKLRYNIVIGERLESDQLIDPKTELPSLRARQLTRVFESRLL